MAVKEQSSESSPDIPNQVHQLHYNGVLDRMLTTVVYGKLLFVFSASVNALPDVTTVFIGCLSVRVFC